MNRNDGKVRQRIENLASKEKRDIIIITTQEDCVMCKVGRMTTDLKKFLRSVRQGFIPVELKVIKTERGPVNLYGTHRIPIRDVIEIKAV